LHTNAEGNVEYDDAIMTPPERISGPDPEYTYLARAHDVQGLMVVKCIVTTAGTVRDCKIVQGLPYMEGAVVDALLHRRYTPARLRGGEPVEVEYTFRIRLQLVR
jgi:protein TonB